MATPLYYEEDKQNFPMNDLGLFTHTNLQGKILFFLKEQWKVKALHMMQSSHLQLQGIGIWLKLHSQIELKPIHNPDFIRLQLSLDLMLIPCACKPD